MVEFACGAKSPRPKAGISESFSWKTGRPFTTRSSIGGSRRMTMRVEYFEDTDTLQITFKEGNVADSRDLDENTLIEVDTEGQLVTITIEHAQERADLESFLYKKYSRAAA
jgi:uncharacterized protein YuzE